MYLTSLGSAWIWTCAAFGCDYSRHPRYDLIEISSSSHELSMFSSKAGSHCDEGTGAMHGESSGVSIGDLWSKIDNLDEAGREGTSTTTTWSYREVPASHPRPSSGGSKRIVRDDVVHVAEKASLDEAPGAIVCSTKRLRWSHCEKKSCADFTVKDQTEWEIILEELIRMGYIVNEKPVSETDD
jgi:hypothetical protein